MKKLQVLSLFMVCFCIPQFSMLNAQTSFEKYQTESIYLQNGTYIKNGISYPLGILGGKIKKELEVSPNAIIEFEKFEKNKNRALILYGAGLGALITGLAIDSDNDALNSGLLIGSLGFFTGSIIFGIQASNNYSKSIWIRNGDILR